MHKINKHERRSRRSSLAKFRCGVAPLRIETGRYTQWPWVSSQNWLTLQHLQNFKHTLRSYNLKTNDSVYLIFSTLYGLSIMNSNVLDFLKILLFKGPTCPLLKPPDFWNTFKHLLLVIIWIHLYLTMNTTYLVYIFGDTDVGLLCWLTEKQNIHVSFPII